MKTHKVDQIFDTVKAKKGGQLVVLLLSASAQMFAIGKDLHSRSVIICRHEPGQKRTYSVRGGGKVKVFREDPAAALTYWEDLKAKEGIVETAPDQQYAINRIRRHVKIAVRGFYEVYRDMSLEEAKKAYFRCGDATCKPCKKSYFRDCQYFGAMWKAVKKYEDKEIK